MSSSFSIRPTAPQKPLFPLLLGPLALRPIHFNRDDPGVLREDTPYLEGLIFALESDVARGLYPSQNDLQSWFERLSVQLLTPRQDHPDQPSIQDTRWPLQGEPWKPPVGDLREHLLARLIHLGAAPWNAPQEKDTVHSADSLVGILLVQGYPNLVQGALELPQAQGVCLDQTVDRRTLLQEAVWQDHRGLVDRLILLGADLADALPLARSGAVVTRLIQAGAKPDASTPKGGLIKHWLDHRDSQTARELIKAAENHISPADRIHSAMRGELWGPLKDALAALPEWPQLTTPLGQCNLRLPALLLSTTDHRKRTPHQIRHALNLLERAPPDDRLIAPGLSELALVRLSLRRLIVDKAPGTQAQIELTDKMRRALDRWTQDSDPEGVADARAFALSGDALFDTHAGATLAQAVTANFWAMPQEPAQSIPERFKSRTLEDAMILGGLASLMPGIGPRYHPSHNALLIALSGHASLPFQSRNPKDPRDLWWDRLAAERPDRLSEIATQALRVLTFELYCSLDAATNLDPHTQSVARLERWLDQGLRWEPPPEALERFLVAATANDRADSARSLAERLPALIQYQGLSEHTQPAREPRIRSLRL